MFYRFTQQVFFYFNVAIIMQTGNNLQYMGLIGETQRFVVSAKNKMCTDVFDIIIWFVFKLIKIDLWTVTHTFPSLEWLKWCLWQSSLLSWRFIECCVSVSYWKHRELCLHVWTVEPKATSLSLSFSLLSLFLFLFFFLFFKNLRKLLCLSLQI